MDFSKAFDTLDHEIVHYKLENCGIQGASFKLKESYIRNKQQYFEILAINFEIFKMNYWHPPRFHTYSSPIHNLYK